jgi:hypothetical protein
VDWSLKLFNNVRLLGAHLKVARVRGLSPPKKKQAPHPQFRFTTNNLSI